MDNTQATTLSDIADTHEFLENPLDVYENYTYNIEWFVVDIDADRKFQEFGETLNVVSIVNDGWPGVEDTKITIAKTGVTTEFNIAELSIEGSGAGIAETSKIAGTALTVEFTVVEVGETSLVDNLQNAIALMGWKNISETHFYIKINFIGIDSNGKKVKIPQTKVLTFTLQSVIRLTTQTDEKGTSTTLRGTVLQDRVIGNRLAISSTEYGFTYDVAETLYDTLGVTGKGEDGSETQPKAGSFMDSLNTNIIEKHPTLIENLRNTYKITMSDQFKEKFGNSSTRGITSNTIENMNPPVASQIGQVPPLMNIFSIINDICLNALKQKKELTEGNSGPSKVFKITPWCVPKKGGWNAITGTMTYNVEFFIDFEEKLISQNALDAAKKVLNINDIIKGLFDKYHINKMYHYLFTGENDQILDLNISLDQYLAKVYSTPNDWFAYENIMKAQTIEGNALLEGYRAEYEKATKIEKELISFQKASAKNLVKYQNLLKVSEDTLRSDLETAYGNTLSPGTNTGKGSWSARKQTLINDFFKDKSNEEIMTALSKMSIEHFVMGDLSTKNIYNEQLKKQIAEAIDRHNKGIMQSLTTHKKQRLTIYEDWIASAASVSGEHNWKNGVKQNAQKMLSGIANKNPKNMILLEELDNDIISKMSNEDFSSILRAQANNPTIYKTLLSTLNEKGIQAVTLKTTDAEKLDLARAKYYESKKGHASMIHATMRIKGDPHWLDGYMPPAVAKKEFGNVGAITQKGYSLQTTTNGYNYLILKSGVAAGTDLHDNILRRNLITHLYTVLNVVSDFSGGIFTQTLTLNRLTDAEDMTTFVPTVGPELDNQDNKNDKTTFASTDNLTDLGEETTMGHPVLIPADAPTGTQGIVTRTIDDHMEANQAHNLAKIVAYSGKTLGEILSSIKRTLTKPFKKLYNTTLAENAEQYHEAAGVIVDEIKINQENLTSPYVSWEGNAATRNALAGVYLNDHKWIKTMCDNGIEESCINIETNQNDILSTFVNASGEPLTVEDRSKASTITAINTQINDMLAANPSVLIGQYEVAMWQHTAGGELDITGYTSPQNKAAIERIVRDTTGERTPKIIIDEQNDPEINAMKISGTMYGAIVDSKILNGDLPLNKNATNDIKINAIGESFAERLAREKLINSPNSNNDWKTTYWFEKQVDDVVKKACNGNVNVKTRGIECLGVSSDTLTAPELDDINILSEEMNGLFQNHELTDKDKNKQMVWTGKAYKLLEREIESGELVISEDELIKYKDAITVGVAEVVVLDSLSEDDYTTVKGYEDAINRITGDSQSGHRGDLTTAVNVAATEVKLAELNASNVDITTKLDEYFWDIDGNRIWTEEKENIEAEMAELMLGQPDEKMTAVVTEISGFNKTYIPIFNTTSTLNDQPAIIKNTEGQFDVVLAGKDNTYGGVTTQDNLDQLSQAKNLFYHLTRTDTGMITFEDDLGIEFKVKDFSNISSYTLADGTLISTPSSTFGIYTLDPNNMVPANKQDYRLLREKVADYFPNIEVISSVDGFTPTLSTLKNGTGHVILNGTAFYISP